MHEISVEPARQEKIIVAASIICLSQINLEKIINDIQKVGVRRLHIDIIDQTFGAPGLPLQLVGDIRRQFDIPIDVHVMIDNPLDVIEPLIHEGADTISIHQSALSPSFSYYREKMKKYGVGLGLVLNPSEEPNYGLIEKLSPQKLTFMTVKPGGAGRPFMKENLISVTRCKQFLEKSSVEIFEADGAVSPDTIKDIVNSGVNQVVVGSSIFPFRTLGRNRMQELYKNIENF